MQIRCSDFLFLQKGADFFVYDKKSAYLYPIDNLHFEIGTTLQVAYKRNRTIMDVQYFVQRVTDCEPDIVREHYAFIVSLLSEKLHNGQVKNAISEFDIIKSISVVPHIVVEVTEKCNLLCRYCYYGKMYNTINEIRSRCNDMPEEDCLDCLRYILSKKDLLHSNRSVISFYGGEPFLNFELIRKIVILCKEEFPDIDFQFRATTNGSLLKTHIDFLVKHGFHLLVSLDGDKNSNIHRLYRDGHPVFTTVKQNIDYIYRRHREYFSNNIEFISVLHKDSDIVSICSFFSKYEKTPILTNLSTEGIVAGKQNVFPYTGVSSKEMMALKEINRNVYDMIQDAKKGNVTVNTISFAQGLPKTRGCYLFANKIFLAVDRQIYLCEKSSRMFPFGSFKNGVLNFDYQKINCYYQNFNKTINRECLQCSLHYLCDKCFFESPSLMMSPIKCKLSDDEMCKKIINTLEYE